MLPRIARRDLVLLSAAALLSAPRAARAEAVTALATAGPWRAYRTTTPQGQPLCGIMEVQDGAGMLVKHAQGDPGIWFELVKQGWRIPARARPRVTIEVDGQVAFSGQMTRARGRTGMLEHAFRGMEEGQAFVRRLGEGQRMRVVFHEGDEGAWTVSLAGTRQVTEAFTRCVAAFYPGGMPPAARTGQARSQPFDAAPPRGTGPAKQPAP